jgi:hypothetical protein
MLGNHISRLQGFSHLFGAGDGLRDNSPADAEHGHALLATQSLLRIRPLDPATTYRDLRHAPKSTELKFLMSLPRRDMLMAAAIEQKEIRS